MSKQREWQHEPEGLRAQSRGVERHYAEWERRGRPSSTSSVVTGRGWIATVIVVIVVIGAIVAQAPR